MPTFKTALQNEHPLQIIGVPNAYVALMAKKVGFNALYLSGAGVANLSYGLPDIGVTSLENVLEEVKRIKAVSDLPLLVDIDTGWDDVAHAIEAIEKAGAAGVHIEDQVLNKRCGHLEGKKVIPEEEMAVHIKLAVKAKKSADFMVMARTDALSVEGFESVLRRSKAYVLAGADALFAEAFTSLDHYMLLKDAISVPILANLTEFGKTPLFTVDELKKVGIDMILYPLSISRAMNKAALLTLKDIRKNGTQKGSLDTMQTREELYSFLKYKPK